MSARLPNLPYKLLLLSAVIGLSVIVVFFAFFYKFQRGWAGNWQVLNNRYVLEQSLDNFQDHFFSFYKGQYSRVNTLFYILVYKFFAFISLAFCLFSGSAVLLMRCWFLGSQTIEEQEMKSKINSRLKSMTRFTCECQAVSITNICL